MGIFGEAYDSYAKMIPADADTIQRQETRRAFYAGGTALLHAIMSALTSDEEPTEQDLQTMDAIQAELDDFLRDVTEGRA